MHILAAALSACLALAVPAAAQVQVVPPPENDQRPLVEGGGMTQLPVIDREAKLDGLFAKLATAPDAATARRTEREIITMMMESGSDTVDLLMSWTLKAIEAKDYGLALDLLDRVVTMKPDYAEGWNKRATVFFIKENLDAALADIMRVLALEPRHFGALIGLGSIYRQVDKDDQALEVFNRALRIDPFLESVKKAIEDIETDRIGQDT